ncbi:MAG: serine hydrolase [Acidobacteriaceae bacterium]|nr:serine hydrolase [Acidobacteriaceae bacterium]MBV9782059.1 serine hydrolase [Acidobacteriaceae bacterium]
MTARRAASSFAILLNFFWLQPLLAEQSAPPADLDVFVARVLKTFEVPGLSIAIVKDGQVVLTKGYGIRKMGDSAPVDEHTLFGIGSNTKAFTSALLASLVDEGKISWDDKVYERLPGFQMYDSYASHEMTIRDLLTHKSGMGLGEGDLLFWPHTTYSRKDIIYRLRFMKPQSSFRSHYAYDNLMYLAAGEIIAAVTGKAWEENVRDRILTPLGMSATNLTNASWASNDNYAWPHSKLPGELQPIDFVPLDNAAPAGSINSSASEMARWILLQLNHGKFPDSDKRLFSEEQSKQMWSPQTILPVGDPPAPLAALKANFADYGLGWGLRDYRGHKLIGHSGGVAGFVSRVQMVPDERLGIVVLTNAEEGGAMDSIEYYLLDHYLNLPRTDWVKAFRDAELAQEQQASEEMKKQANSRAAKSSPSLSLEKYAGAYNDVWYGPSTIRMENGKLVFTLDHTPKAIGDLEHWQYDTFKTHWRDRTIEDAFLTFALKPDGDIDHFTMVAVSPLADFSFDYQDLYFTPVVHSTRRP